MEWSAQARPVDLDERARYFNAVQVPLAAAALDEAERPLDTHDEAVYRAMVRYRYTYNFHWMGRPIIQLPEDMVTVAAEAMTNTLIVRACPGK